MWQSSSFGLFTPAWASVPSAVVVLQVTDCVCFLCSLQATLGRPVGWAESVKQNPKKQLRHDVAKEGLRPPGDVIKLLNHLPCCWRCSSGAIVALHSAGSHLVRLQQRQLVGLISPGHAVLHSNLRELLQTAAAGLKWDLILSTEGQQQNQCCPLTKSLLSRCHPGYCCCDRCPPGNFTSFFKKNGKVMLLWEESRMFKKSPEAAAAFSTCRNEMVGRGASFFWEWMCCTWQRDL